MRPSLDTYFMNFARVAATRATCPRASVGAVLVRNKYLLSSGYNGSRSGEPHCVDEGCLIKDGHCVRTVHSEWNAIDQCKQHGNDPAGSTIYCTHLPCFKCAIEIVANGIVKVVYNIAYRSDGLSLPFLWHNGIEVIHYVD